MSTVAVQSLRNGVDTAKLFATLDAVKAQPEAARFRFSVDNRWISGTHNRNQITPFGAAPGDQLRDWVADHNNGYFTRVRKDSVALRDGLPVRPRAQLTGLAGCRGIRLITRSGRQRVT